MLLTRVFCVILFSRILGLCQSRSKSYVRQIYNDLFSNYTKSVLPVEDHTRPLVVDIQFYLSSLHKFSEIEKSMTITGSFNLNWTDSFLTWNPALYGYTYLTFVDSSDIWTPPLMLVNTVGKMESVGGDSKFQAMLLNNGNINYGVGDIFEAKCAVDISDFPFDEQQCSLLFMTWGLPPAYLNLSSNSDKASLEYFYPNADWTLKEYSTKIYRTDYTVTYEVSLTIKRSSLYYGVMVIAPTILFAVMNPLVFLLPVESGERVGLAMTILLSYAIFLTIVSSSIPASSNPMCVLLIIMVIVIFFSGFIVFGVILSLKYFNEDDSDKIASCLRCLVERFSSNHRQKKYSEHITENVSGKDVAKILDSVFFYGSYIVMVTTIVAFVLYTNK